MDNALGKITAKAPTGAAAATTDTTLPDPSRYAKWALAALIVVSVGLAVLLTETGLVSRAFLPAQEETANFALFAGFYVAAQLIVALMALFAPLLPPWGPPQGAAGNDAARVAHQKADRVVLVLGLSTVLGVAASCVFGLFFLQAIGMQTVPAWLDAFATGLVIAGGAKPLHDLISMIQNQNTPKTGTGIG